MLAAQTLRNQRQHIVSIIKKRTKLDTLLYRSLF